MDFMKEKKMRLSIPIDSKIHKNLKIICINLGISLTDCVLFSVNKFLEENKGKNGIYK